MCTVDGEFETMPLMRDDCLMKLPIGTLQSIQIRFDMHVMRYVYAHEKYTQYTRRVYMRTRESLVFKNLCFCFIR